MTLPRLALATRNAGKIAEIREILGGLGIEWVVPALLPEVVEDAATFRGNAEKKARAVAEALGLPALADDSGLEVDALAGAPGVLSARYAGPRPSDAENNRKLLETLRGIPPERRRARFRCVAVIADPAGRILAAGDGTAEGRILDTPRGRSGFGYDPLFLSEDLGVTFAEAGPEAKNRVSHRARALAAVRRALWPS